MYARRARDALPILQQYEIGEQAGGGGPSLGVVIRSADVACTAAAEGIWRDDAAAYLSSVL